MKNKTKIFILEGLSTSGKTSVCRHFKKKGIRVVEENKSIKSSKLMSLLDLQSSFLEKNLRDLAFYSRTKDTVIFDRSFPSTLAFTYANDLKSNLDLFQKILDKYQNQIDKLPKVKYIYLRLSVDDCIKRRNFLNKSKSYIWSNKKFIKDISNFYDLFFKDKNVETINANMPLSQIINRVGGIIENDIAPLSKSKK